MTTSEPKMGVFKRARYLAKASMATLKADKEIVVFPILSGIFSSIVLLGMGLLIFFTGTRSGSITMQPESNFRWDANPYVMWPVFVLGYICLVAIAHFFEAMVYSAVQQRFEGNDPTLGSAYNAARKKLKPLLLFSVMMASVGLAFQALEERVPFAGKIAVWIFNAAWSIANVFAIPVILSSKEDISPIAATKKSAAVIKKVWGENVIAQLGIGIIGAAWLVLALVLSGATGGLLYVLAGSKVAAIVIPALLFFAAVMVIVTVMTTLTTIVKAAVFHFAMTGQSPEKFSKELLRSTITLKKSRKLFAAR